ncbi:DUF2249 domain-containing protein [Bacillus sp. Marseille-P3661]|uniref:DUF2249 domain-containing protein n=1 Tax=Bacillus sp. Marseille-P3661 TaxID=1936234 RepID=UPI000C83C35F|nr:DUF2249 domain-containing protein [Bacillus sp. Marseille-P3661]
MTEQINKVVELDVREDIQNKQDPFQKIMCTIETFNSGDTLILYAPFKPTPLLGVLGSKGYTSETEELAQDYWKVTFIKG